MRRFIIIALLVVATAFPALSQKVTDENILRSASLFLKGYLSDQAHRPVTISHLNIDGMENICVVTLSPSGWLLMASDQSSRPVIGFSLEGDFSAPSADPLDARYAMLKSYSDQIRFNDGTKSLNTDPRWSPDYDYSKEETKGSTVNVTPFMTVTWNQGKGWNRFCPEDAGGPDGHAYAGCVAVSMAQAMSVYGIPATGTGSNSYLHPVYGTLYVDFSAAEYRWNEMSASVPDDNNAMLIYHCGVAVSMDFGPDGSGTRTTAPASSALKNYFSYSQRIVWNKRLTNAEEWRALLNKNLLAGRPIIYSGLPPVGSSGHAFNIDGVYKSEYYHLNWGWSGSNNGYYTLDQLKPGTSDFTQDQAAILNIQPFYYPTGIDMSDTLVFISRPSGLSVGEIKVIDEATDNSYIITLECDSVFLNGDWVMDYFIDDDTLRTGRSFSRADGPTDTVTYIINDTHGNTRRAESILLLTDSQSVSDQYDSELVKLYPVPAVDNLYVTVPHDAVMITITSLAGSKVYESSVETSPEIIPVRHFLPGHYTLTLVTRDKKRITKSFIKK